MICLYFFSQNFFDSTEYILWWLLKVSLKECSTECLTDSRLRCLKTKMIPAKADISYQVDQFNYEILLKYYNPISSISPVFKELWKLFQILLFVPHRGVLIIAVDSSSWKCDIFLTFHCFFLFCFFCHFWKLHFFEIFDIFANYLRSYFVCLTEWPL